MSSKDNARFSGLLWGRGALNRGSVGRFAQVPDVAALIPGDHDSDLMEAGSFNLAKDVSATELVHACDALNRSGGWDGTVPLFLGMGSPFDPETWVSCLLDALETTGLPGAIVTVLGSSGPPRVLPLTSAASSYVKHVRACVADRLQLPPSQVQIDTRPGPTRAREEIERQGGDLFLVYATHALKPVHGAGKSRTEDADLISASDTVHIIIKDSGLEVSNRTDFLVKLRVRLGDSYGTVLGVLSVELDPRGTRSYAQEELVPIRHLDPPVAELRQWSHEAEVVYVGGEQRIHGVDVEYWRKSGHLAGSTTFGAEGSHVVSQVSTEISRTTGQSTFSMASRLRRVNHGPSWRDVLSQLRYPDDFQDQTDKLTS